MTQDPLGKWIDPVHMVGALSEFRILEFLFPNKAHTKSQIALVFNIWEKAITAKLNRLKQTGLIANEHISFGIDYAGRKRAIYTYQLSEIGRFLLHQMETLFFEPWLTTKQ